MTVSRGVGYVCPLGGRVEMDDTATFKKHGVNQDGYAYWDDLHIRTPVDLAVDLNDTDYRTQSISSHIIGENVISFGLDSPGHHQGWDLKVTGLKADEWYAVEINGRVPYADGGPAEETTDSNGTLTITGVEA